MKNYLTFMKTDFIFSETEKIQGVVLLLNSQII